MNRRPATSLAALIAGLSLASVGHAQVTQEPTSSSISPSVPPAEGAAPSAYVWAGTWFSNHYAGGYTGFMQALNRDESLWDDGPVLRFDASGGRYTYDAPQFSRARVEILDVDVLAGFRKNTDSGLFSAYVGPSYITHENHDRNAPIRGSKFGAAFLAEYANATNKKMEVTLQGRYSTPFSTYSAAGRALYKVSDKVWLGPQVTLYGNNAPYREITAGPFLKVNTSFGEVGVTGGYRHPLKGSDSDGYFASVYFALPIHP